MSEIVENPGVGAGPGQTVTEVNLVERANVPTEAEKIENASPIEGLISFDQLVMNFLQQHHDTLEEYKKLSEALDNMHYTSTITKISLEELQQKKDQLNKLSGAIEALALYKKHVDPNVTDREFVFDEE
jgi:hypothetical protein|tara:strand:- start:12440 stop:12826 length:387 start_codon:yes stop_codon:yes gene_type:complete